MKVIIRNCCKSGCARVARFAVVCFAVLALLVLPGAAAFAQSTTGSIHGQVGDPTGAVIPGATVVVMTTSGKVAGKAVSDGAGQYTVQGLAPGTYSVTATAQGFAAFRVPNIAVAAGQARSGHEK